MRWLVALMCAVLWVATAEAKHTVSTVSIGKLSVVTEIDGITDTPIMHAPLVTKKVRLEWRSPDRRVRFFLEDDGATLTTGGFDVQKPDLNGLVCGTNSSKMEAYQTKSKPAERWWGYASVLTGELSEDCTGAISASERIAYGSKFTSAAPDFAPALETMKAAAQEQFGGWRRRCLDERHIKNTWASFRCVRYSAKEN